MRVLFQLCDGGTCYAGHRSGLDPLTQLSNERRTDLRRNCVTQDSGDRADRAAVIQVSR
jgi:hypothetical protein